MATNESGPLLVARVTARGGTRGELASRLRSAAEDVLYGKLARQNRSVGGVSTGHVPLWEYSITEGEAEAASLRGQVAGASAELATLEPPSDRLAAVLAWEQAMQEKEAQGAGAAGVCARGGLNTADGAHSATEGAGQ